MLKVCVCRTCSITLADFVDSVVLDLTVTDDERVVVGGHDQPEVSAAALTSTREPQQPLSSIITPAEEARLDCVLLDEFVMDMSYAMKRGCRVGGGGDLITDILKGVVNQSKSVIEGRADRLEENGRRELYQAWVESAVEGKERHTEALVVGESAWEKKIEDLVSREDMNDEERMKGMARWMSSRWSDSFGDGKAREVFMLGLERLGMGEEGRNDHTWKYLEAFRQLQASDTEEELGLLAGRVLEGAWGDGVDSEGEQHGPTGGGNGKEKEERSSMSCEMPWRMEVNRESFLMTWR